MEISSEMGEPLLGPCRQCEDARESIAVRHVKPTVGEKRVSSGSVGERREILVTEPIVVIAAQNVLHI